MATFRVNASNIQITTRFFSFHLWRKKKNAHLTSMLAIGPVFDVYMILLDYLVAELVGCSSVPVILSCDFVVIMWHARTLCVQLMYKPSVTSAYVTLVYMCDISIM